MNPLPTLAVACGLALATAAGTSSSPAAESQQRQAMQLGVFSISLAVKDIKASKALYEKLDFKEVGGTLDQETLEEFQDVRNLQRTSKQRGLTLSTEADESSRGPASFVLVDPDGNPILFDQHVPSPKH